MTGYGRGEAHNDFSTITLEMKSVNHRFLETNIRLPRQLALLEDSVKKSLQTAFSRGKIDVYISYEQDASASGAIVLDEGLANDYRQALARLAGLTERTNDFSLEFIASLPGILTLEKQEDDLDQIKKLVEQSLESAITEMKHMRDIEGEALVRDLSARIGMLRKMREDILALAPQVVAEHQQKLYSRIEQLLTGIAVDEAKLLNEVAFFADKADITEELTRLESHLDQFDATLIKNEPVGRKLEFILQEILREINTIGSKSNSLIINQIVIDAKSELEKIREQIQNIE